MANLLEALKIVTVNSRTHNYGGDEVTDSLEAVEILIDRVEEEFLEARLSALKKWQDPEYTVGTIYVRAGKFLGIVETLLAEEGYPVSLDFDENGWTFYFRFSTEKMSPDWWEGEVDKHLS